MSGIYALQAMGEDEEDAPAYPEAPAEVVIDRMAAANVSRFRWTRTLPTPLHPGQRRAMPVGRPSQTLGQSFAWTSRMRKPWGKLHLRPRVRAVAEGPPSVRFSRLVRRAGASQQSVLGDGAAQDLAKLFQEAGAYGAVDPTLDREHEWSEFVRVLAARKTSAAESHGNESFAPCRSCATTSCSGAGQPAWGTLTSWTCSPSFRLGRQLLPGQSGGAPRPR